MKSIFTIFLFSCVLLLQVSAQIQPDPFSKRFFTALNHYQGDSLKNMLGFDFQFRNAVIPLRNISNEKAFNAYFSTAVRYQKKYVIKKVINAEQKRFLVEEQGAYLKALGVAYPEFIFILTTDAAGRLGKLDIDTTKDYPIYTRQLHEKSRRFEDWRKKKMVQPNGLAKYGDPDPQELPVLLKEYEKSASVIEKSAPLFMSMWPSLP